MIINNLYLIWASCFPNKTDTILIVNSDAMLSMTISSQTFKPIPRREEQLLNRLHRIQLIQLA